MKKEARVLNLAEMGMVCENPPDDLEVWHSELHLPAQHSERKTFRTNRGSSVG